MVAAGQLNNGDEILRADGGYDTVETVALGDITLILLTGILVERHRHPALFDATFFIDA